MNSWKRNEVRRATRTVLLLAVFSLSALAKEKTTEGKLFRATPTAHLREGWKHGR
jgi:hypothetical protein